MDNTNTNNLEAMINEYQAKKDELKIAAAAVLQPMWSKIVEEQSKVKAAKDQEKKANRIAYLKEELAKLES